MKRLAILLLCMTPFQRSFADTVTTPQPKPATNTTVASVSLTAEQINAISAALYISASHCVDTPLACTIGAFRPDIVTKLQAAMQQLQPATGGKK